MKYILRDLSHNPLTSLVSVVIFMIKVCVLDLKNETSYLGQAVAGYDHIIFATKLQNNDYRWPMLYILKVDIDCKMEF